MSESSRPTFSPSWAMAMARFTVTVLFPTPPLPEPTTTQRLMPGMRFLKVTWAIFSQPISISAEVTPGCLRISSSRACLITWTRSW